MVDKAKDGLNLKSLQKSILWILGLLTAHLFAIGALMIYVSYSGKHSSVTQVKSRNIIKSVSYLNLLAQKVTSKYELLMMGEGKNGYSLMELVEKEKEEYQKTVDNLQTLLNENELSELKKLNEDYTSMDTAGNAAAFAYLSADLKTAKEEEKKFKDFLKKYESNLSKFVEKIEAGSNKISIEVIKMLDLIFILTLIGMFLTTISSFVLIRYLIKKTEEVVDLEISNEKEQRLKIEEQSQVIAQKNVQQQELIHVLCHDLKNPVGACLTTIQMIELKPERLEHYFPKLKPKLDAAIDIIDVIRVMMAMESGKKKLDLVEVDLSESIKKSIVTLENKFESKKIIPQLDIEESIKIISEPITLVNSVINNLVTNAIKFSPEGARLDFKVTKEDESVVLKIRDYGIGMPESLVQDVFDPLKTTSRPGTSGEKGTGFGMPLVKSFVEAYGGEIFLTSREKESFPDDHGTEIIIKFKAV